MHRIIHDDEKFREDLQIYDHILEIKRSQMKRLKPLMVETAFFTHVLFKAAVMAFMYFREILQVFMSVLLNYEIVMLFIVIDFWFTKNYNGRRLIGLRWFFDNDRYGTERFCFQSRINDQFVGNMNFRIFWFIQLIYIGYPFVNIYIFLHISVYIAMDQFILIGIQFIIIMGGLSNLFLFYKAYTTSASKKYRLRRIFGQDFMQKLSNNSIYSYM